MLRTTLALALVLALGCGATSSPAGSVADPGAPPASSAAVTAGVPAASGAAAAAAAAPGTSPPSPASDKGSSDPSAGVSKTTAVDAPINTKITQDDILALVQKNADAFYLCYTLGAAGSKDYRAKVTIKATVSPVGAVNAAEVVSSTTKNAKVDTCVSDAFKKLTFNRPKGSGATVFTFPLSFDGMAQVQ